MSDVEATVSEIVEVSCSISEQSEVEMTLTEI
jgi:hypothetical protein